MLLRFAAARFSLCVAVAVIVGSSVSAQENVAEYGEIPGVDGRAQALVTVERGNVATLIATARVSGGVPIGNAGRGVLERAGDGVDIFVDDESCAADRDIRRRVDATTFEGQFATSATCMTLLRPGEHTILAERTSINTEGAKMVLKYTVLGGTPARIVESE